MSLRRPLLIAASSILVAGTAATLSVVPASASTPKSVNVNGHCSGTSTDNLQVQREDTGRLSVDFGVDMARHIGGVPWKVAVTDNGTSIVSTTARTISDGSFSITRSVLPQPGLNSIAATAKSARTGETCTLSASL